MLVAIFYLNGVHTSIGWAPAIFVSTVFLFFCIWEGGLWGIQKTNVEYVRFKDQLNNGNHIFFVDVSSEEKEAVLGVTSVHPKVLPIEECKTPYSWSFKTN